VLAQIGSQHILLVAPQDDMSVRPHCPSEVIEGPAISDGDFMIAFIHGVHPAAIAAKLSPFLAWKRSMQQIEHRHGIPAGPHGDEIRVADRVAAPFL
jgi:hypothetical protein